MEFRLLGSVEVIGDGPVVIARRRERLLLAVLLLEQGRSVTVDRLFDLLWDGEPPLTATAAVRSHVSRLRALLPDVVITRQDAGYRLSTDPDTIDVHRFHTLVRAAAEHDTEHRAAILREALALWRGPALADVASDQVRARLCAGLEEQRLAALDQRLAADLALDVDLVAELTELVAVHPTREGFAGHLMLALHRAGRQADALRVFDQTRRALADELGVDPGQGLRDLHERILRADPGLNVTASAGGPSRNTLPYDPPNFTGRAAEFAEARSADPDTVAIIAVDGMPGVGKTAFAVRAAHELAPHYPDGQLFVDLHAHTEGRRPVPPETALVSLLRAMGVPNERIPASLDDRASAWRAEVHGKRILAVLDNAADIGQITPLIPASPGSLVLVTSRRRLGALPGARSLSLDVLTEAEAVGLFAAAAPARVADASAVDADVADVTDVVALCGRLPLAIRIAAARLHDRPSWTVRHLADRLRAERDRCGQAFDGVAAVFALSYQQLDPDHQRMFRLVGGLPGIEIDAYAAAALADVSLGLAEDLLEELVDVHLVEQRSPGRYRLHDLLSGYARALTGEEEFTPGLARVVAYYLEMTDRAHALLAPTGETRPAQDPARGPVLADDTAAIAWCDADRANLVAIVRLATGAPVWRITRGLAGYLGRGGHLDEGIAMHLIAVDAALDHGDREAELLSVLNLGVLYWRADDYRHALDCVERALLLARALEDVEMEAACLNRIALFQFSLGDYRAASEVVAQALLAIRAIDDVREEAVALWLLSGVEQILGDAKDAYRTGIAALAIDRSIGDRHGIAATAIRVGEACAALGRHEEGARLLTEAIGLSREISDRANEVSGLVELATLHRLSGEPATAEATLADAMLVLADIRQPLLLCAAHRVRGDILLDLANARDAVPHYQAAGDLARGIDHRLELARALDGLSRALTALGEHHAARAHHAAARTLHVEMGIPNRAGFTARLVV